MKIPQGPGLGIEVDLSLPAARVIRSLEQIIEWRGKPRVIRCDNGPEYISGALLAWAERQGIRIEHIQPGKPQQNAYIERYNRTVRYAWLAQTLFDTIKQVQDKATRWLWTYNHERPNMALGGITPKNAAKAREMGFDGIAFIGSVWKQPDPVRAFLDLERAWYGKEARKLKRKY